jgi:hypothetical protein
MALKVEGVVDGDVHAQEALDGSNRFEPLHLVLSSSHDLMRVSARLLHLSPLFTRTGQS